MALIGERDEAPKLAIDKRGALRSMLEMRTHVGGSRRRWLAVLRCRYSRLTCFATREACTVVPAVINRHKDNTKRHTQNSDVSSLIFIREMHVISIFIINE